MTLRELGNRIQGYYGRYSGPQKAEVIRYLQAHDDDKYRDMLWDELVKKFSTRWGKPPTVAEFEEFGADMWMERQRAIKFEQSRKQIAQEAEERDPQALERIQQIYRRLSILKDFRR